MKKTFAVLVMSGLLSSSYALAEEKFIDLESGDAISLRAEIGVGEYAMGSDKVDSDFNSDIAFLYTDLTAGATLFKDRFYLDGYVRAAIATLGADWEDNNTGMSLDSDENLTRYEFNITPGYLFTERLAVFLGFRYAETSADQSLHGGSAGEDNFEFETFGTTLGLKYSWVFDKHVVGALGGVTYATGDLKYETNMIDSSVDSLGGVLGLSYRYLINDNWDIGISADVYHLDFGEVDQHNILGEVTGQREVTENTASIRVGLNYTF